MSNSDLTTRERYALSHAADILQRLGHGHEADTITRLLNKAYDAEESDV